jgi:hypothetical protein
MQTQGVLSGLLTVAQEGAQLSAGDFNARAGLPVRQFLEKVKLKPEEQQAVRDVTRILSTEFLSNVKANKGLLGVNPTDNDAISRAESHWWICSASTCRRARRAARRSPERAASGSDSELLVLT